MGPEFVDPPGVALPPDLLRIGWKEYLDFPEWRLRRVRVKIDTGAWTSALDVAEYAIEEADNGVTARVRLPLHRKRPGHMLEVRAPVLRITVVSNPGGQRECRPVVEALVRLGAVLRRIPLTLTSRSGMRYRMLLGRQALAGNFLVDVSQKYLLGS
jgi:hypothetical protein